MKTTPEYSEMDFYVKGTECSPFSTLAPHILLGDMQETADKGAGDCGFDRYVINKFHACWIILRMRVHVDRFPDWREDFTIRTWSRGCDKLFFDREYEVYDKNRNIIGYASSVWILADMETHRPLIPKRIEGLAEPKVQQDKLVFGEVCPKFRPSKLENFEGSEPVITKYADYSELDHNHHVNNTRYVAWVFDALYKYGLDISKVNDFTINYICEVKVGEKVDIYIKKTDKGLLVTGFKGEGTHVFDSEIYIFI